MKSLLHFTMLVLASSSLCFAEEVRKGDLVETAYEKLGRPSGVINLEDKQFLYYSRGHLEVIGDRVVKVALISEEEYRHNQEVARRNEAMAARVAREKREARIAEGRRVKERVLNDPDFVVASGQRQIDYWKKFSSKFPEIDIRDEIQSAAERQRAEKIARLEVQVEQQRVANLERQLRDANDRAAEAERDARRRSDYGRTVVYTNPYAYQQYAINDPYARTYGSTPHSRKSAEAIRPSANMTVYGNRVLPGKVQVTSPVHRSSGGTIYRPSNSGIYNQTHSNPYNNRSLYSRPQTGISLHYSF